MRAASHGLGLSMLLWALCVLLHSGCSGEQKFHGGQDDAEPQVDGPEQGLASPGVENALMQASQHVGSEGNEGSHKTRSGGALQSEAESSRAEFDETIHDHPASGFESPDASPPQNVAGAWLTDCGILESKAAGTPRFAVCTSRDGSITRAHLLDQRGDVLRDRFREISFEAFDQIIATELPSPLFLEGAFILLAVDVGGILQERRHDLKDLKRLDSSIRSQSLASLLELPASNDFLANMSLNPECDEPLSGPVVLSFEVKERRNGSCRWAATLGDIGPKEGFMTASLEDFSVLQLTTPGTLCKARLRVKDSGFYFNDEFALLLQRRLVAGSFGDGVAFSETTSGFPLYRKSELMGLSTAGWVDHEQICFGLSPAMQCVIPQEQQENGLLSLEMDIPLAKLRYQAKSLELGIAAFGDDDGSNLLSSAAAVIAGTELDCQHDGLRGDIEVWIAPVK